MKKIIAPLMAALLSISLCSCKEAPIEDSSPEEAVSESSSKISDADKQHAQTEEEEKAPSGADADEETEADEE